MEGEEDGGREWRKNADFCCSARGDAHASEALSAAPLTLLVHRCRLLAVHAVPRHQVGLGGSTDATNVIPAGSLLASVVTAVGSDHMAALGGSVASIARAKGGIIQENRPVGEGAEKQGGETG